MTDLAKRVLDIAYSTERHSPERATLYEVADTLEKRMGSHDELIKKLRKGLSASAGFVRDSKDPAAIQAMWSAIDAVEEVEDVLASRPGTVEEGEYSALIRNLRSPYIKREWMEAAAKAIEHLSAREPAKTTQGAEDLEPYRPCVIENKDSGISEFLLHDRAGVYCCTSDNTVAAILDIETRALIGFAWLTKHPPASFAAALSEAQPAPTPFLTADLEDGATEESEWIVKVLRSLAAQLGVVNDFYFPLLSAAQHIETEPMNPREEAKDAPIAASIPAIAPSETASATSEPAVLPEPTEEPDISHVDLCRLSQVFNRIARLDTLQDYRINEWLKEQLAARSTQSLADRASVRQRAMEECIKWLEDAGHYDAASLVRNQVASARATEGSER